MPRASFLLFERHPQLAASLPRVELATLPTPVEEAPALARDLGVGRLFVKRDDLSAPMMGGGKVRKLELLLGDALARGAEELVTFGGVASNHALATAHYGRRLGLEVSLFLLPQPGAAAARESLLFEHAVGAELVLFPTAKAAQAEAARRARAPDHRTVVLPAGGSSRLGNVGFVNAGMELASQIDAGQLPAPDRIYLALGTMGSAVGLAIGLAAAGVQCRIVAVRASSPALSSARRFDEMFARTVDLLVSADPSFPRVERGDVDVLLDGDELGGGYAVSTATGRDATERFRARAGLELDPTYTAKAAAALVRDAPALGGRTVLFWQSFDARPPEVPESVPDDFPPALRHLVVRPDTFGG